MAVVATFKVLAKMHGRRGMMEQQEFVSMFFILNMEMDEGKMMNMGK